MFYSSVNRSLVMMNYGESIKTVNFITPGQGFMCFGVTLLVIWIK